MFTIPVFVAILTGRGHADIMSLHETKDAAIDQCRMWTRSVPGLQPELVPVGFEYFCQYGTQDETVRVEKHQLELSDTETDNHSVYLPRVACVGDMPDITITSDDRN